MTPTLVRVVRYRDVHERSPARTLGLAGERHADLMWKPVSLARVAGNARANDVFPSCLPAAIPRHDVIQVQHLARKNFVAILASIVVPLKNILAREFHLLLRQTLEEQQHNDSRHPNAHRHRFRHFRVGIALRKILPTLEIMGQKTLTALCGNHLRVPLIKQRERAAGTACIHRLPEAVENQNGCVENRLHKGVGVGYGHPFPQAEIPADPCRIKFPC